jgi:dTDP-glucose 4,6-dehydratase
MPKKVLVTGGAGFIGHHIVEHLLKNTDCEIIVLDRLTYASSGFDRLRDIQAFDDRRVRCFTADLASPWGLGLVNEIGDPEYILHLAAETHVDCSIDNPWDFIRANIMGTFELLQFARTRNNLQRLLYFSTDEVFGPASPVVNPGHLDSPMGWWLEQQHVYREWDRYNSTNPYSATKAAGEELCLAWANTYKVPVIITHTMNCFGERQHPEKFIPMVVRNVLAGETVTIHSDISKTRSGSRFYIHCRNVAAAVTFLLDKSHVREKYNIVGEREVSNLEMAQWIADILGCSLHYEMADFHSSRPGHDLRYGLDGSKMAALGWTLPLDFEQSLQKTIKWMVAPENARWLNLQEKQKVSSGN